MNSHLLSHHKVCKQLSGTLNEFEGLQIYKLYSAVQPQGIRCLALQSCGNSSFHLRLHLHLLYMRGHPSQFPL